MHAIKSCFTAIVLMLACAMPVTAGPFEEGEAAFARSDFAGAVKWYRSAADRGHAQAQTNLGGMYDKGQGVPQNYAEALKWYRLAAAQGNAEGQFNLGLMYFYGEGVPKNYTYAHIWLNLSAAQNDGGGQAVKFRDNAARFMTTAQIAEAQKIARGWKPTNTAQ